MGSAPTSFCGKNWAGNEVSGHEKARQGVPGFVEGKFYTVNTECSNNDANRPGDSLAVVTVLGSLYPVMTILLARAILGERLRRVQQAGVLLALVGAAVISLRP